MSQPGHSLKLLLRGSIQCYQNAAVHLWRRFHLVCISWNTYNPWVEAQNQGCPILYQLIQSSHCYIEISKSKLQLNNESIYLK